MEVAGIFVILLLCLIAILIVAAVVRYAVDSSKTSKKLGDLITEVQYLRNEIRKQNDNKKIENKHIIDERV
ncbi:hypothetical protein [Cohnella silvisoli]|uniref:DUF4083 domain-containing protein n=1 Tax=Cohnella silvisoli TaxID=2873699 RepID=A0ABV1L1G9_9BACL|nr:hypothetical protein [Cohnella silvisoli]MCD9025454.1 hypothetical protein [Cohnella silvisoli]